MLISQLGPVAARLSECQDTVWTDKDLPVIYRLHLSLFSNKAALCLSLHALLLPISVDWMSFFSPSALFVFSTRHQMEAMVFNCVPSIRRFWGGLMWNKMQGGMENVAATCVRSEAGLRSGGCSCGRLLPVLRHILSIFLGQTVRRDNWHPLQVTQESWSVGSWRFSKGTEAPAASCNLRNHPRLQSI